MSTIGALAKATGCPIETIRYYEKIELMRDPPRSEGGHRLYGESHKVRLLFIRRARDLGFSLDETRDFIRLSENESRSCNEALAAVQRHLETVAEKLMRLEAIQASLLTMADSCRSCCPGAKAPECTIIGALAGIEMSDKSIR
ncbi:MerR family transcriptional regulator [Allohahella sp. A8]|uniref:MerR family transcriptional regulator n=1 Tax=Allohahella sp. A8 TaxID=3141461 RepID=UPI003A809B0D